MTAHHRPRLAAALLVLAAALLTTEWRPRASGTIAGVVFEDFNGNGTRDTTSTVASSGAGTTRLAVDRGLAGITVSVFDSAGAPQGTTTTGATGAYSLSAAGTGPYRVEFTNLPAGYRPSAVAAGATGNGTTVQFVPDGNTANVNLGILDGASFCQNNPTLVTSCFVYGDQVIGPFSTDAVVVDFPYAAGANSATAAHYNQPAAHALMVPAAQAGSVYGLAYRQATNTIYAGAFMKKHAGFGPAGPGAIYTVNPSTGAVAVFADLNAIFPGSPAGTDPHDSADYDRDNGDTGWDAVGKVGLGGLELSPDGATVYVVNMGDRQVYALPTSGPLTPATVSRVPVPLNAPGATAGGADLRPFALQWHRGLLYLGMVNSAESTGLASDLLAYVYTLNPSTLTFSATPVFQFALNYPRGLVQTFGGAHPAEWRAWEPQFISQVLSGTAGTYPQPMLAGLSFDPNGNLTIGLRDRAGDQFGFFALDQPSTGTRWEGVAAGDTLLAAITVPGNMASGWTLEANGQAGSFGPSGGAGTGQGPGNGEYFYQETYPGFHDELSGGSVLQLPGYPDVLTSAFDPGLNVRAGGFIWHDMLTGGKSKGYNLYINGGNPPPPAPTFSKANGFGETVAICQAAPIEIGNRVWDDVDADGVQDPGEAALDGVTVQLVAPGGGVLATAVTANGGQYYFSSGAGTTTGNAIYNVAGLTPNTGGYVIRIATGQGALGGRSLTLGNNDPSGNGDSRDSDGVTVGANAEVTFATGAAGANDHTYDFGFTSAALPTLSLGNLVWYDTNNNGVVDGAELPVGGVDVVLYRDNGNGVFDAATDTLVGTQTTSGGGLYLFTGLTPGNYFVQVPASEFLPGQPLSGYQNSTGRTSGDTNNVDHGAPAPVTGQGIVSDLVTLTAGGEPTNDGDSDNNSNLTIDFGFYRLTLGNLVFIDADNSGTFNAGDTPRDGVAVDLLDAAGTTVLASTVTAGGGLYQFTGLTPGDYRVRITPPAGYTSSTGGGSEPASDPDNNLDGDDNGSTTGATITSAAITLTPGAEPVVTNATGETANPTVDFGLIAASGLSLGNLVWLDLNNNGVADPGEPGLAGVTMRLIAADGVTVLATTVTNGSGFYLFPGLAPGTYYVEVDRTTGGVVGYASTIDLPTSADPNTDVDNDDNGVTVTPVTVRSGAIVMTALGEPVNDGDADPNSNLSIDFGFVRSVSVGNLVWGDTNDNGVVDPGETGIAGVTVRLIAADGVTVLATTTTDAAGHYLFGGLPPGSYYIEVVPPPGAQSSTDIPSSGTPNNDVDHDDNGVTVNGGVVRSGLITLTFGGEPTTDGDTNPDSNLTVDFGFVPAPGGGSSADICLLQTVPASITPGSQFSITYTAVNRGPGLATDVVIDGMIPTGTTFVSATPSAGGVCTVTNGMLDCRWPGFTAAGPAGDRTVTLVLQANAGAPGGSVIWSWFMSGAGSAEPYPSNNMVDSYVFVADSTAPAVDLVLSAAAQAGGQTGAAVAALVGQPAQVRFTVTNTGPVAARGQYALLLDELGVIEITGARYSQGWAGVSSATSGVWETELIAAGGTATLDLTVVPRSGAAGKLQAVRVAGAPADPNAVNDSAEVTIDAIGPGSERFVAAGNLDGAPGGEIATGAGAGETPQVQLFSGTGVPGRAFYAFDRSFRGGVRVAACDVNGDGTSELITAQGPGGGRVRVLSLASGVVTELVAFDAFEPGFTGGVNVACGDIDGDGRAEVVVGPGGGRAPDVKVFTVGTLSAVVTAQFQAYEAAFTGGVRVSAARFGGSPVIGAFNVATMPGPGRATELRLWSAGGGSATMTAAAPLFGTTAGGRVVVGDANGDGALDVVLTPDGGTPALLQIYSLATGALLLDAAPGTGGYTSVNVALGVLSGGPGTPELVIGNGPGLVPTVGVFGVTGSGAGYQRLALAPLEQP